MPRLDSVAVVGYKSIRHTKIALGPVNVLIGANGTGKSNLLGLFGLLADLADERLQLHVAKQGGADALLHFGRKQTESLEVALRFGPLEYHAILTAAAGDTLIFSHELASSWSLFAGAETPLGVQLGPPGSKETQLSHGFVTYGQGADPLVAGPVVATIKGWRKFHFHDTGPSSPAKQKRKIDDNQSLRAEGENIAPFLYALRTVAPGAYRRIVEAVRSVAPFFDDFALVPDAVKPDVIQLAWRHRTDDSLFTADTLSDGTLRFICLATLLLQPELPSMIVIDEPELGLHPFAITKLVALLRAASTKTQVLLATQSVTLLNHFVASEVIVAEREDGESTFRRLDEAALAEWLQEYSLGELWLKNVLGGRPR